MVRHGWAQALWDKALAEHRAGDPTAEDRLVAALDQGLLPGFEHACALLHPPAPRAMAVFFEHDPRFHCSSGWSCRVGFGRDTLVHAWARTPVPLLDETPAVAHMTALLWRRPKPVTEDSPYPHRPVFLDDLAIDWWGDRNGHTPRMEAARHGHWPLLKAFSLTDSDLQGDTPAGVERDKLDKHWVDHWVDGVLARQEDLDPESPSLKALEGHADVMAHRLLTSTRSAQAPALVRLAQQGVDVWGIPVLHQALALDHTVLYPNGRFPNESSGCVEPLSTALLSTQPLERLQQWLQVPLMEWSNAHRYRIQDAAPWFAHPEKLLMAVEHSYFSLGALGMDAPNMVSARVTEQLDHWLETDRHFLTRLLNAINSHYYVDQGSGYQRWGLALRLQHTLSPGRATMARTRL